MASTSRIATKLPLEMLYHWERQCPDRIYLRQTINREYVDFTWGEVADEARRMVTALRALGLVPGTRWPCSPRIAQSGSSPISPCRWGST